jgi:hypothetical protein
MTGILEMCSNNMRLFFIMKNDSKHQSVKIGKKLYFGEAKLFQESKHFRQPSGLFAGSK